MDVIARASRFNYEIQRIAMFVVMDESIAAFAFK